MIRLNRMLPLAFVGAVLAGIITWQVSAERTVPISQVSHIHGMAVDPADPSRLLLATHYGLYRATPDGTTTRISETQDDFMGFTAHPQDRHVFFASGHPAQGGNLGFIRSEDGGKTWRQISPGANGPVDFHAMDVSPADPNVVYGLYGDLQVSFDGGENWRVVGPPPAEIFSLAASAQDAATLYAATRAGLMVSRDGGGSWEPAHLMRQPATVVDVAADGTAYAFVVGHGLLRTAEPSLLWLTVNNAFGERVLLHLAIDPTDSNRVFAATSDGAVLESTDGGEGWSPFGG
jgi:photosystem II stability/assembly factor-like uncharacterized protein